MSRYELKLHSKLTERYKCLSLIPHIARRCPWYSRRGKNSDIVAATIAHQLHRILILILQKKKNIAKIENAIQGTL